MRTLPLLLVASLAASTALLGASAADEATAPRTLVVGSPYPTIQAAVDAARAGDVVFVPNGSYQEAVLILKDGITLRGQSRTGVVLEGGREYGNGVTVNADNVSIESMTAQNYVSNGFAFARSHGFRMFDLHARNNGDYGLYAIHSFSGEISYSYGEGHGDSGFYIGETKHCDCDVHHNVGWNNMIGYSGTANSYVRIWENEFHSNRAGILMSVLPQEMGATPEEGVYGTQVHTRIYRNYVHDNNNRDVPETGTWQTVHVPVGEGITIAGGWMNEVHDNLLVNNDLWGVGMFWLTTPPRGNLVHGNTIVESRYGVWWDEMGEDNCFGENAVSDVQVYSDPDPLPTCPGLAGDLPCPAALTDWAACRASDVRAPGVVKFAGLAHRSLTDQDPDEGL